MAEKATPAPAARPAVSDAPLTASAIRSTSREGVDYPSVVVSGDAPRKGSTLRVRLENGRTYTGKVFGHEEAERGQVLVHTEGLEPFADEPAPE